MPPASASARGMTGQHALDDRIAADDVVVVRGRVSRRKMRKLVRQLCERIAAGRRRLVLDITEVDEVAEGHLSELIGVLRALRREVNRRRARLVIAASPGAFKRLSQSLTDVAPTLAEAIEQGGPRGSARPERVALRATDQPSPMRCLRCGTTWYSRVAALVVDAELACARCGGRLVRPPAHR